ncbi:MAG: putative hydrolase of the alpha/beta superfamily protein [Acidobacteria bacterium]|nr:putative hydrolase of the alpha/beta superfamily protein [Acidobacteriota bacterium]
MTRLLPLVYVSLIASVLVGVGVAAQGGGAAANGVRFEVAYDGSVRPGPFDGRLLVMVSTDDSAEPRFQVSDGPGTQVIAGVDVEGWRAGAPAVVDGTAVAYPVRSLSEIPAGTYTVQALLQVYETFHRADGKTVKLPMDRGEGRQWNRAPGNLYGTPRKVTIAPGETVRIALDQVIPPIPDPPETKYIKHVRIQSEKLTKFWGRPMFLGAHVLLPAGFDEHPAARYPLVIDHGHFPYTFEGFREEPPDPALKPVYSERFHWEGYNRTEQELAHQLYKDWTGPGFPRFLLIQIQHANPYYDDSYAVNSENLGPYGDAINEELIPAIERKFRGLGQGWARFMYGGSTGGWEALGVQVLYPDFYNGCFAACPDPIDFRQYTVVNIYDDKNAYFVEGPWRRVARPGSRNYLGHISTTIEAMNRLELVLGENGRSGGQWDIWQAVFSPVGPDGYPKPIWDKRTGAIDPAVAAYWKERYDIGAILRRDWATLGPKLQGKIHIYVGEADNFFLNNAVYLVDDFLKTTKDPHFGGEVDYGARAEHCWNGDHTRPNAISRLRYAQMFAPKIVERILETAPKGADVTSWRY